MKSENFATRLRTLPSSRRESLASIFRKAEDRWPNPEDSVGRYIGKDNLRWIQVHIWEATGPARDIFINSISPRMRRYLENAKEPIPNIVTWSIYMVGKAPNLASPFILFCCEVSDYRRDVQNTIKESGILDRYPGIKTDNLPREPGFAQLVSLGASGQPNYGPGDMIVMTSRARSACGSQIFIDSNGTKSGSVSTTPVATIGGVIRLGAKLYYTTAAHALSSDPDSINSDAVLPADDGPDDGEDVLSLDRNEDTCSAPDSHPRAKELRTRLHPGGSTDHSDDDRYLKDEILRQSNLKSHHEAEDPLSSFAKAELSPNSTGRIFMTSTDGQTREAGLDYALIEMSAKHHVVENVIQIAPTKESTVKVHSVVKSGPQDREIVAVTPRGTIKGWISGTPVYLSMQGKRTYCRMLKAILSGPLRKGDCGTWVVDAMNGDLFGHVVLGSPGSGAALLVPFSDIFDDILSRVGESPVFPTAGDDKASFKSTERRISSCSRDDALARLLRQTISSIRELPEVSCGSDDGVSKRASVSPIGSEQQTKGFSDPLSVEKQSDVSREQVSSKTRGGIKRSNVSTRDHTAITETNPAHQERTLPAAPDTSDRLDNISENVELTSFVAQNNVDLYWQREQTREVSGDGVEDNSSSPKNPTRKASSEIHASVSRPRRDIPPDNEPLDPSEPPRDPKFHHVLSTFGNAPLRWENTELLDQALKEIDLETVYREADEESGRFISLARSRGDETKPEWGYQDCIIRALSTYFRQSFFTRIKRPSCKFCRSKLPTSRRSNVRPTPEEKAGRAEVVELYQCVEQHCQAYTRFPRYWDPKTLLLNPRGRAGEIANCFGLLCRALGSRVRWVWNAEDNIWTEVFSEHQRRWVHVDPFEDAWDDPLLYTETMGKKLSYCIALSLDGVTDVTRRYVRSSRYSLARTRCSERELLHIIQSMRSKRRQKLSKVDLARLESEDEAEDQELESYLVSSDETGLADH